MNCFLDEGSNTTYVNEDVIETLGISTEKEEITILVANDQKVRLMAATLEIGLESVDGKVDTTIVVKTSDKICGGMKPTDWVTMKQQWNHSFPTPRRERSYRCFARIGLLSPDVSHAGNSRSGRRTSR